VPKSPTPLIIVFLAGLCVFPALMARGQAPAAASWTLNAVRITGSNRFADAQILATSGLQISSHVTKSNLDDAASTLLATGAFAKVAYTYQTRGDAMTVTFQVTDAARFLPCIFDNFVWFTDDQLLRTVQKSVPLFDGSIPEHGGLADDVTAALGKLLTANGIPGTAEYLQVGNLGQAATAVLLQVQGSVPSVSAVQFTNGPLDPALLSEGTKLLLGKPYSRTLARGVADHTFAGVYENHGYLRAKYAPPKLTILPGSAPGDPGSIVLEFTVDAGTQFHWAALAWSGNQALTEHDLNPLVTLKSGDIAAADKIANVWTTVQDLYGTHGYLTVELQPTPRFDDSSAQVRFAVAIAEGPQYRMGNLNVDAATSDLAQKLRAAWDLKPGDVYNSLYSKIYVQVAGKEVSHAGASRSALLKVDSTVVQATHTVDVLVTLK
jgi:outer membrane protein assembly factor BamA